MEPNQTDRLAEQEARLLAEKAARDKRLADQEQELLAEKALNDAARPTAAATSEDTEGRHWLPDVIAAIPRGALKAVDASAHLIAEGMAAVGVPDYRFNVGNGRPFIEKPTAASGPTSLERGIDALGAPETVAGGVVESISQFVTGFATASRYLSAAGLLRGTGAVASAVRGTVASAAASAAVFEAQEANLADMIEKVPALQNPVTAYLAGDIDDSELEGRLKNAAADALGGIPMEGLVWALRSLKAARAADLKKAAGDAPSSAAVHVDTTPPKAELPAGAPEGPAQVLVDGVPQVRPQVLDVGAGLSAKDKGVLAVKEIATRIAEDTGGAFSTLAKNVIEGGDVSAVRRPGGYNAGLIDWSTVDGDPADVLNILEQTEAALRDTFKDHGARVSMDRVNEMAEGLRKDYGVKVVLTGNANPGDIAASLVAKNAVLLDLSGSLARTAKSLREAGQSATAAARAEFHMQLQTYAAVKKAVTGQNSEAGRALAALGQMRRAAKHSEAELRDLMQSMGTNLDSDKLIDEVFGTIDPSTGKVDVRKLDKLASKGRYARVRDAALQAMYDSLLSSPKTWVINSFGGFVKVTEAFIERPTAAALTQARKAYQRATGGALNADDGVALIEVRGLAYGAYAGLKASAHLSISTVGKLALATVKRDADAVAQFRKELSEGGAGTAWQTLATGRQFDAAGRVADVPDRRAFAALKYETPDAFYKRAWNGVAAVADAFTSVSGRVIASTDSFYKTIGYEMERQAQAYKRAQLLNEAGGGKKSTAKLAEEIAADVLSNTESVAAKEIAGSADTFARQLTFQEQLSEGMRSVERGLNAFPEARIVVPFFRTPINILKQALIQRTPLAGFTADFYNPGRVGDIARARALIGTSALASVFFAADREWLRGGGPQGRDSGESDGVLAYSMKVGDRWYQFSRLEPLGMLLGFAADLRDINEAAKQDADNPIEEAEHSKALASAVTALAQATMSKTWLAGLHELAGFLSEPTRNADAFLASTAFSLIVPKGALLRSVNREDNPQAAEAFDFMDRIKAQLPGLSDNFPLKRDWLGRPVVNKQPFLSPVAVSRESADPLDKELGALRFPVTMPSKKLHGIQLNADQYSRLLELRGQVADPVSGKTMEQYMRQTIASPEYQRLHPRYRAEVLKSIASRYLSAAKRQLVNEDEALRQKAGELHELDRQLRSEQDEAAMRGRNSFVAAR